MLDNIFVMLCNGCVVIAVLSTYWETLQKTCERWRLTTLQKRYGVTIDRCRALRDHNWNITERSDTLSLTTECSKTLWDVRNHYDALQKRRGSVADQCGQLWCVAEMVRKPCGQWNTTVLCTNTVESVQISPAPCSNIWCPTMNCQTTYVAHTPSECIGSSGV